jgi:hypothetical protein
MAHLLTLATLARTELGAEAYRFSERWAGFRMRNRLDEGQAKRYSYAMTPWRAVNLMPIIP